MTKLIITHSTSPPSFPFFRVPSFSHKSLPGADSSKDPVGLCSTSLHLPHGHPLLPEGRGRRTGETCHHTLLSPLFLLSFCHLSSPLHFLTFFLCYSLPRFLSTPSLSAPLPLILPSFLTSLLLPPSLPLLPPHHSTSSSLPPPHSFPPSLLSG